MNDKNKDDPIPAWLQEAVTAGPKEPGGPWFLTLKGDFADEPIYLNMHHNHAIAREEAEVVQRWLLALLRHRGANL